MPLLSTHIFKKFCSFLIFFIYLHRCVEMLDFLLFFAGKKPSQALPRQIPRKGELLCIFRSAPIKLPREDRFPPAGGKCHRKWQKGESGIAQRCLRGFISVGVLLPTPHRKEIGKKMSKSVDNCPGVWYYTWAPSAETKEWLLKAQQEALEKNQ